jgi:hypothetical protein
MINIYVDIPILLEHRSQIEKYVFLGYHLTIESNILLLLVTDTIGESELDWTDKLLNWITKYEMIELAPDPHRCGGTVRRRTHEAGNTRRLMPI